MQYSFEDWLAEGGHAAMRFALNKSYSRVAWVYSCINAIATAASGAPLAFYKGSVDSKSNLITDVNHPVFTLFNPPKSSSIISFRELIYRTFILLGIDGIAYWVFERQNDIPVNVELKRKGQIVPIIKGDPINGVLLGYKEVKRFGEEEPTYKIKDVVPISFFNPDNPWSGLSPLTASRLSIETEYNIGGWNSAFFKNGLKVPLILQAQRALTPDQKKEIRKEVQNYYSGIDGTQGAFLASGVEAKPTILNPKDLDFIEGKKLNREEICSVFGVPPAIVGIFEYSNYCVTGDTLITLENGATKPIIEIKTGERVLTMGENSVEAKSVLNLWENGLKTIYKVSTGSRSLKCSENHKFYCLEKGINPTYPRKKVWKKASELKLGDYLAIVREVPEKEGVCFSPEGEELSSALMHQIGLYIGDGTSTDIGVSIAIPDTDEDKDSYIEEASKVWKPKRKFADGRGIYIGRDKYTYRICSVDAANKIKNLGFYGTSHTKRIPKWVFTLTTELKQALLKGIFDSDGHFDKFGRVRLSLCNKNLVNDIRDLCINVGYHVNNIAELHTVTNYGPSSSYSIVISFNKGGHSVKQFPNHPLAKELVWQKIRSLEILGKEDTFDLEIEGTHNYFANWMVTHNSNVKEQRKIFWENTLLPKMQMIADLIQINLLNLDFPGIRIKWNLDDISALRTDPIEVANAAKIYADIGVPLLNISRLLNLPELEPGKDWKYSRFDLAPKRERQQNNRQPKLPATTDNGNPRPNKPPRSTDDEQVDNNNAVAIENLIDKVDEAILYFLKGLCDHKTLYLIVNADVWLNTWDDLLDSKLELQNEFKDIIKASHILADFMITSDLKSLQNCIKSSRKFATLIVESIQQGLSEKRK